MRQAGPVALTLAAFAALPAYADEVQTGELEEVVVTANKAERPISKVTASVEVIKKQDIERMGATTLKDVLAKTPGLVVQYGTFPSGNAVSKSSLTMRGMGKNGTLWLLDGRRLAGEVTNPYDMDRIPASVIERVEIVKGPMSALYGADAMGGVINIITKQPEGGFGGEISVSAGANRHGDGANKQISGGIRGKAGIFSGSLYASSVNSDPYTEFASGQTRILYL